MDHAVQPAASEKIVMGRVYDRVNDHAADVCVLGYEAVTKLVHALTVGLLRG